MVALRATMIAAALTIAAPGQAAGLSGWQPFVTEASIRFGVPERWIWRVMAIESAGRTQVGGRPIRSPKGAMGLMQLMPDTWRDMRAAYGLGPDPDDPHDNIIAGTAYLRLMYDRFGYPGLFAAYNAGPARYVKALGGAALPRETQAYVARAAPERDDPSIPRASLAPRRDPIFFTVSGARNDLPAASAPDAPTAASSSIFVALGSARRD